MSSTTAALIALGTVSAVYAWSAFQRALWERTPAGQACQRQELPPSDTHASEAAPRQL